MIFGIDISSSCIGLAVIDTLERIHEVGVIESRNDESDAAFYDRIYETIQEWLMKYEDIQWVVIEDLNIRFLTSGKKILPIHGVVKAAVFSKLGQAPTIYNVSTYRFQVLKIKKWNKVEIEKFRKIATTHGHLNKSKFNHLKDIKHNVIEYINKRFNVKFNYDDNDIVDAIALAAAHLDVLNEKVVIKEPKPKKKRNLREKPNKT